MKKLIIAFFSEHYRLLLDWAEMVRGLYIGEYVPFPPAVVFWGKKHEKGKRKVGKFKRQGKKGERKTEKGK